MGFLPGDVHKTTNGCQMSEGSRCASTSQVSLPHAQTYQVYDTLRDEFRAVHKSRNMGGALDEELK